LASHMFIFYTAMLSMITPPVALAAYAAANIAHTDPMKTGYTAMRFGFSIFILPFLFAIWPVLLLKGTLLDFLICFLSVAIGIFLFSISLVGYLFTKINIIERILFGIAGISFMILPKNPFLTIGIITHILGLTILLGFIIWKMGRKLFWP